MVEYGKLFDGAKKVHIVVRNDETYCRKEVSLKYPNYKKAMKKAGYFGHLPICKNCLTAKHATPEQ